MKQRKLLKESERACSYRDLQNKIQERLYNYTEKSLQDSYLGEELHKNQEEYRRAVSGCIRDCSSGNYGAKEVVLDLIYTFLSRELLNSREELLILLPFHEPEKMSARQQLEAMIFFYDKEKENQGFGVLCRKSGWAESGRVISREEIQQAYLALQPKFTPKEEMEILARLLFADTVGLGVIDTLNQQKGCIEEIQVGMSGRAEQQYNYKDALFECGSEEHFSRDGVHIMVRGCTVWIKALSFETEEELQRVLRNLVKGTGNGELTKNHPMIVADTPDGRRISVSRPPVTDTWIGLIRKFDTVQAVSLELLYQDYPEGNILISLIKQLVRSGRNIAITGEMASGKTTLFRACLAETKKDRNIRVIEADSFELNIRGFLPKVNSVTMRVTEQTPAEEVLAFARKTTGQIFAIGEINSAAMAAMAMDLSKIASQLLFSAHYVTTEHMVADFVNAKLCIGGYSEEKLAELDVVRCLGFDIHLSVKQGKRHVQYINEVVPRVENKEKGQKTYEIRAIYQYDEEKEQGVILNPPSGISYERAKQLLGKEEYLEFVRLFET